MLSNIVNGSQDGTGANIDIELGFIPSKVEVFNTEAADFASLTWFSSMPDGSALKRVTSTWTRPTTLGITPLNETFQGFRIGADTDVNVAGETIHWVAYRNGPGSGA